MKEGNLSVARVMFVRALVPFALSSPAMAAGNEILIGAPVSMTGAARPDGLELKWAYEQAVADWNKKGRHLYQSGRKEAAHQARRCGR